MMNFAKHLSTKVTEQTSPIPGSSQVENSAGGFVWTLDDWGRLDRLLVLGTEGGSYYASERKLTLSNFAVVERLAKSEGLKLVARIVEISEAGRAPKNDPAIYALACALKHGDPATRAAARAALPKVCRIGTHLFQFATAMDAFECGWGRGTKRAFGAWYTARELEDLALQLAKYQQRDGWSHRDLLRLAHPKPKDKAQDRMLRWAVGKPNEEPAGGLVNAFEDLKALALGAKESLTPLRARAVAKIITDANLPRECVPTGFLNSIEVWDALLHAGKYGMPMTAMIRNLGKMSSIGLVKPLSAATQFVCEKLRDAAALKAARVHPMQLLLALATYRQGHGDKGSLLWQPSSEVITALDDAFYLAFANVEPTGKRFMLALDISGSMGDGRVAGTSLTPREASAAMAMVTARTEQRCEVVGFTAADDAFRYGRSNAQTGLTQLLGINARASLADAVHSISDLPMGNTDCSLPMVMAKKHKLEVDVFIVYTDSESFAGPIHASQALRDYRQSSGIDAKLITCAMVASEWSIGDPNDRGSLDVCGFDSAVPSVIAEFIK